MHKGRSKYYTHNFPGIDNFNFDICKISIFEGFVSLANLMQTSLYYCDKIRLSNIIAKFNGNDEGIEHRRRKRVILNIVFPVKKD